MSQTRSESLFDQTIWSTVSSSQLEDSEKIEDVLALFNRKEKIPDDQERIILKASPIKKRIRYSIQFTTFIELENTIRS